MRYAHALLAKGTSRLSPEMEASIRAQIAAGEWSLSESKEALEEAIEETIAEWRHHGVRVSRSEIVVLEVE